MSSIETWIFNDLSLKHLATVKTVEVFWKQSHVGQPIKQFFNNIFQGSSESTAVALPKLHRLVTQQFESFLDKLTLKPEVKHDLNFYFWQMFKSSMNWLRDTLGQMLSDCGPNKKVNDEIYFFLDNMAWNNVGLIDGKKMVEAYVSDKEIIDYDLWAQLCNYCSEHYIRKFADGIDWTEGRIDSNITIYWYCKIYETFPTEDMFDSPLTYMQCLIHHEEGLYEDDKINSTLLTNSVCCDNLSAVKYFWSRLTDAQKLEQLSDSDTYIAGGKAIALYMLGQGKFNYFPPEPMDNGPWKYLLCWPWVLFIDSWLDECKKLPPKKYIAMFHTIVEHKKSEMVEDGDEEFARRLSMGHVHKKYYSPCAKLWTLCDEKFGAITGTVPTLATVIFYSGDMILCKIVMEGSSNIWRKMCFEVIGFMRKAPHPLPNRDFCQQFMREALLKDDEKRIFKKFVRDVAGYRLR